MSFARHWCEIENQEERNVTQFRSNRVLENGIVAGIMSRIPRLSLPFDSRTKKRAFADDSFCGCYKDKTGINDCECGEYGKTVNWVWDDKIKTHGACLQNKNKDVKFHVNYSGGTAAIRGIEAMTDGQHYWEVKMISHVYGTDMMVGIGTETTDIFKRSHKFCSILGSDCETWGLSYTGSFHHEGKCKSYAPRFGQGSIIGVHLDMWDGTLAFYKNRKPLGIACSGLKGKTLYAMVSSTAARSGMRIIRSSSFSSSLQYLCCRRLRNIIPADKKVLDVLHFPPGLHAFLSCNLDWLLGEENLCTITSDEKCLNVPIEAEFSLCLEHKNMPHVDSSSYLSPHDCTENVTSAKCRKLDNTLCDLSNSESKKRKFIDSSGDSNDKESSNKKLGNI